MTVWLSSIKSIGKRVVLRFQWFHSFNIWWTHILLAQYFQNLPTCILLKLHIWLLRIWKNDTINNFSLWVHFWIISSFSGSKKILNLIYYKKIICACISFPNFTFENYVSWFYLLHSSNFFNHFHTLFLFHCFSKKIIWKQSFNKLASEGTTFLFLTTFLRNGLLTTISWLEACVVEFNAIRVMYFLEMWYEFG